MSQKYDEFLKNLLRLSPRDFARWILPELDLENITISLEDREFEVTHRRVDSLLKIETPENVAYLHIEFQGELKAGFLERLLFYNSLVTSVLKAPVLTVAIFLRTSPQIRALPTQIQYQPFGRETLKFSFEKIILPEIEAEELIRWKIPSLLPLVSLTKIAKDQARDSLEKTLAELDKIPPPLREDYKMVFYTLSGYNYGKIIRQLLGEEKMKDLMESETYRAMWMEAMKEGMKEGIKEGMKEGMKEAIKEREEGMKEGMKENLKVILKTRFGEFSSSLVSKIDQLDSKTTLERLLPLAVSCESLGVFENELK